MDGLGSEFLKSSGVSISELWNCEMVLKTVCVESSESMRGELVVNEDFHLVGVARSHIL